MRKKGKRRGPPTTFNFYCLFIYVFTRGYILLLQVLITTKYKKSLPYLNDNDETKQRDTFLLLIQQGIEN